MDDPIDDPAAVSTSPPPVTFRVDGDVAHVTLSRPEARNALSVATLDALYEALEQAERDENLKIALLLGSEQAFSSGLELAEHTDEHTYQLLESFHRVVRKLQDLECVSISVVKGMAVGAGCELAASCDFCFASEGSKLGQPELKAGLFPTVAPTLYPRLIGRHRAMEMILTGRIYEAREAESIGLITRAIAPDAIDAETRRWIGFLRGFSTPVLRLARRAVADSMSLSMDEGLRHTASVYLDQLMSTEDAKEGVRAIRERRSPEWRNK